MAISVEKIPGGLRVDGLDLRNGKCGCTTVLPCCYSWSRVKRSGDRFLFTVKATGPETTDTFTWGYTVKKEGFAVEVSVEDARDKTIFSGFFPPRLEEWVERGWEVASRDGEREDLDLWRCAACRSLYTAKRAARKFEDLPPEWTCPVCNTGRDSYEQVG